VIEESDPDVFEHVIPTLIWGGGW